jgi:muramoyltetrapeptide carboxypeptidase LdcA involved in peptidoglycan recycling
MKALSLKIGDTVGIFSPLYPGSNISPETTELAIKFLENKGFNILRGREYWTGTSLSTRNIKICSCL